MSEVSRISPNVNNLAFTRGRVSFAPFDSDGTNLGEIDLGNCLSFDMTNAIETKEHRTSHDSLVVLDTKKPSAQLWTAKVTPEELSKENMILFFLGDAEQMKSGGTGWLTQTAGQAAAESVTAYLDRWVPLTYRMVVAGSISGTIEGSTFAADLAAGKIRVDYENGMVMFLSGYNAVEATAYTLAYNYAGGSLPKFVPRTTALTGFLRYRGLSEVGPRHEVKCWKVQLLPDAALSLIKPQDYAGLSFSFDLFLDDDTGAHPNDPFFQCVELYSSLLS